MLQRAEASPQTVISPGFRILDLEHVQNTKDVALFSGRHSMALHIEGPFVKNFTFFIFGFFPMI